MRLFPLQRSSTTLSKMRRFFPLISVVLFGAAAALMVSSAIAYRLSLEPTHLSDLRAMAFLPAVEQKIWSLGQGLFVAEGEPIEKSVADAASVPAVGPRKSFLLLGVIKRGERSTAIIKDVAADSTALFGLGDFVFGDVEHLARVEHNAAFLNSMGGERRLELGVVAEAIAAALPPQAGAGVDENGMAISRSEVNASVRSAEELLGTSQIVPEVRAGKIAGFKVQAVQPGSIVQKMGISPGDIIKKVNAYDLNSLERSMEVWEKMKKESQIHMLVERNGQEQVMSYYLKP